MNNLSWYSLFKCKCCGNEGRNFFTFKNSDDECEYYECQKCGAGLSVSHKPCEEDFIDVKPTPSVDLEMALKFAKWVDYNCVRSGEDKWTCKIDNFKEKYTTREIFDIFNK